MTASVRATLPVEKSGRPSPTQRERKANRFNSKCMRALCLLHSHVVATELIARCVRDGTTLNRMDFIDSLIQSQSADRLAKLLVKHSSDKSCWVALPPALANKLYEATPTFPLVLEIQSTACRSRAAEHAQTWHVAWTGSSSRGPHMEIPTALANCLGIAEGLTVAVKALSDLPSAIGICVEPVSTDDWEVVEQNAGYMEEQVLTQVGVVQVGQAFPFWVRHQTVLRMKVSTALPASLVRLVPGSEVAVAPRPRRTLAQQNALQSHDVQATAAAAHEEEAVQADVCLRLQGACQEAIRLRHQSSEKAGASTSGMEGSTPYTTCIYISKQTAKQAMLADADLVLVSKHHARSSKHVLSVRISNKVAIGHAMLPEPILASLQLQQHGRLQIQSISTASQIQPKSIVLHPIASSSSPSPTDSLDKQSIKQILASWTAAQASTSSHDSDVHVPLQTGTVMQLLPDETTPRQEAQKMCFELELRQAPSVKQPAGTSYALLAADDFASSSAPVVSIGSVVKESEWHGAGQGQEQHDQQRQQQAAMLVSSDALHKAAQTSLQRLVPLLAFPCRAALQELGCPCPGGLLISGPPGCGKTGLAELVAHTLQHHPQTLTHTVIINCQDAASDNPANIMKYLIPKVQEALDCLPSLLVLDDLHLICPAPSEGPEGTNTNNGAALVEWLCDVIDSFHPPGKPALPVAVLATCNDAAELAGAIRAPGCLDHSLTLPAPGAAERTSMLASHLACRGATYTLQELQEVASQAEGYDAADLRVLVDRAVHAAARRQLSTPLPGFGAPAQTYGASSVAGGAPPGAAGGLAVSAADLAKAREGFQPAAAWGVGQLQGGQGGVEGWQDVGGLAEVRAALQEALELPTKYANLISRAPLRLRTGVLLYGPPGCGKTHIVAAAVAAAGMRFVSVKGPEVLNKYIGASEAAVRDLFRRASAAAPCVLFFDEFDAIAPQRGHDSTGVTDRVVNQLLTELDGVEGLTGVCVLAATSRPDLLDAALLRPGRLDRLIHCGFPTARERAEIIRALARRLRLEGSVDLEGVGHRAEGYTGADLSALLSEAQLAAVHERLEEGTSVQDAAAQGEQGTPIIMARHVEDALTKARPSVPSAEKRRLEAIYAKFSNNRDPNIGGGADYKGKGKQLATLA